MIRGTCYHRNGGKCTFIKTLSLSGTRYSVFLLRSKYFDCYFYYLCLSSKTAYWNMDTSANPGYFFVLIATKMCPKQHSDAIQHLQSRRLTSKRLGTSSSSDSDSEEVSNHLHFPGNSLKILVVINICC